MAPVRWKVTVALVLLSAVLASAQQACIIPTDYKGDWYWMSNDGSDAVSNVNNQQFADMRCVEIKIHYNNASNVEGVNSTMLMQKIGGSTCFICLDVLYRTKNILQVRKSDCFTSNSGFQNMCPGYQSLPTVDQLITYFRQDPQPVNCITTFEGVYQFTYEVSWGGGGICDNQDSQIKACQDPGSAYVDNEVFYMTYSRCPEVQTSYSQTIRYQCMGSWFAMVSGTGYTFAAIADTVQKDRREKFKCLMTLKNQKSADNTIRWVMSRFAECGALNSLYNGPVRLVLRRIPPQTPYMNPQCNLPRNISGEWYTQGIQFKSQVVINDTHVKYFTNKNEFEYEETYLSCQQMLGTRYLMTKVIVGKCEVDFVCYDIVPRHHGIVRYRVVDPPSPVICPVAGRYTFDQNVQGEWERYSTRIRGVTDRPRNKVDCRLTISELKSCSQDRSRIEIDAEYCESVDYRGRPIGEYDEPDHYLTCVGYWMEDMKSYLVTYDEEDAVSKFRCWVYERISWTELSLSRSQTARCQRNQKAVSYLMEGTGLQMVLHENERLFDDCPQRFDPGIDPYSKPTVIYVLSSAPFHLPIGLLNAVLCILVSLFLRL
ncbi:hypothetical protein C0Q70_15925 [Pomacea canaliculata]|uniref:Uncharacterized protein n=1 Tax=Pomacea canaliculata TaxID=400727 RepID=A0A2T7NNC1_POMCA|nr:hypothetical protein C0Q70_15925 [Pomacea canaliculata]